MSIAPRLRYVLHESLKVAGCLALGILLPTLLLLACFALFLWWIARPYSRENGTYAFGRGEEIRLSIHGDVDDPAALYYEVRSDGAVVSPLSYLELDPEHDLDVHQGTSADGSVIALWWPADGSGRVILYHRPSRESLPRLADTDTLLVPEVGLKWRARYALLRASHPELPPPETVVYGEPEATSGTR